MGRRRSEINKPSPWTGFISDVEKENEFAMLIGAKE